ncbi:MAG: hypothetical protein DYG87_05235 [Anaerolineae bacterium CFX3]|nr:hypothetical protein [Chloroflexota bacterium]MCE7905186.1 hypothetical protein [Anaerolineae bacterium CFX3]MCQ3946622.1 hypothetical protein [Anaerolineae bacterium]RIK28255.1 MAG: hypothetical protein DCC54_00160 [Anaerolineae bacterium]GER81296.1 conserved hypothetical protein [Candidatus Denitrolinea symbiosum]
MQQEFEALRLMSEWEKPAVVSLQGGHSVLVEFRELKVFHSWQEQLIGVTDYMKKVSAFLPAAE